MAKQKRTQKQILAAIEGSSGIYTHIAKRLDVSLSTVKNYEKQEKYRVAIEEERNKILDVAETVVYNDITKNKNIDTAKWFLIRKGHDRGYGDKIEHMGTQQIEVSWKK